MCVLRQVRCGGPGPGLSRVGPSRRRGSWAWFGPRTEHRWVGEGWGRTRSCRPASSCAEGDWAADRGSPAGPDVAWARAPGGRRGPRAAEARWEDEGRCSSAHHPGTALEQLKQLKPTASGFITHLRTHYSYTTCCLLSALTTAWLTDITTCIIKWAFYFIYAKYIIWFIYIYIYIIYDFLYIILNYSFVYTMYIIYIHTQHTHIM